MSRQLQTTIIGPQSVMVTATPQTPQHVCGGPRLLGGLEETDGRIYFQAKLE